MRIIRKARTSFSANVIYFYLKAEHIATAHIVVHRAAENIHGIVDDSRRMKHASSWNF